MSSNSKASKQRAVIEFLTAKDEKVRNVNKCLILLLIEAQVYAG
jgi:hypothetical protein